MNQKVVHVAKSLLEAGKDGGENVVNIFCFFFKIAFK